MNLIIFDMEMNQPSGSIIEIGAVKADLKHQTILSRFQTFVNISEDLNPEIEALTGITKENLLSGLPLDQACQKFWDWCLDAQCGRRIGAWGDDLAYLQNASQSVNVEIPGKIRSFDIAVLSDFFRFAAQENRKRGGLKSTLESFGIEFEGQQHRATDDSEATAKLAMFYYKMISNSLQMKKLFEA